jgi:hypothetical protein
MLMFAALLPLFVAFSAGPMVLLRLSNDVLCTICIAATDSLLAACNGNETSGSSAPNRCGGALSMLDSVPHGPKRMS